jgi:hypothetical protein
VPTLNHQTARGIGETMIFSPDVVRQGAEQRMKRLEAEIARLTRVERAARAFEADLSQDCDGPLRDTLRAALSLSR